MSRFIKLTFVGAALALIASSAAFAQPSCDPSLNHYRLGSDQYAAGQYADAFASYGCFLSLYPAEAYPQQAAEAYTMRGNALREQGDLPSAVEQYTLALTAKPTFAMAYNNRGWALYLQGDDEAALQDYRLAIVYDPDNAYAYNNRGLLYQMRGDLRLAARDFERAIALGLDPASWATYNLSLVELVENRGTALAPAAPVLVSAEDTSVSALLSAGIAAHDRRAWMEAVSALSGVLEMDPDNSTARYLRGRSYIALDRFDDALEDFDQLVRLTEGGAYPGVAYASWERAIALAEVGRFEKARADVSRANAIDPAHVNNFIARGTIAALSGDEAMAGSEFLALMLCWEQERVTLDPTAIDDVVRFDMAEGRIVVLPFEAKRGQTLTITAVSTSADPVMVLLGPDGRALDGDDDGGFMLNAVIEDHVIERTGTYTLQVSHAGGGSTGEIVVAIRAD